MSSPKFHLASVLQKINSNKDSFSFEWEFDLFEFDEDEIFLNNNNLNDKLRNLIDENPEKMLRCFKLFLMVECNLDYKLLQKHKYKLSYNHSIKLPNNVKDIKLRF